MSTTEHAHSRLVTMQGDQTTIYVPVDLEEEDPYLEMVETRSTSEWLEALEVLDAFGLVLMDVDDVTPERIGADRIRWFAEPKE